jgi:AhpC/TSA family
LMLALPALPGQDKAKDEKKDSAVKDKDEKKPASAKEQYNALVQDFGAQQSAILAEYRKAKGEEQTKLANKYRGLGKEFADKFYKLAEDNPKEAVATDALLWVVQNASGSEAHTKAVDKVTALVADTPLKDLVAKLKGLRVAPPAILDAALARAEKDEKDPAAADLVGWVATSGPLSGAGKKAADKVLDMYPDHPSVDQVVSMIARTAGKDAEEKLKALMEKDSKRVKAAASLALARTIANKVDRLADSPDEADKVADEAAKFFATAIDLYKDDPVKTKAAQIELNAVKNLRVGKEAPDIKGPDLDGKEFKLSDYRGKVVMLDFWGHW